MLSNLPGLGFSITVTVPPLYILTQHLPVLCGFAYAYAYAKPLPTLVVEVQEQEQSKQRNNLGLGMVAAKGMAQSCNPR